MTIPDSSNPGALGLWLGLSGGGQLIPLSNLLNAPLEVLEAKWLRRDVHIISPWGDPTSGMGSKCTLGLDDLEA
jgi:hypothetical protein